MGPAGSMGTGWAQRSLAGVLESEGGADGTASGEKGVSDVSIRQHSGGWTRPFSQGRAPGPGHRHHQGRLPKSCFGGEVQARLQERELGNG